MDFKVRRKIKPKLLNELSHLKTTRTTFNDFSSSFLLNASKRYNLMHKVLKEKELNKDKDTIYIAAGQYVSSLVTCWETFFRDIFVYAVEGNSSLKLKIEKLIIQKGMSTDELKNAHLTLGDYGSKQYNFQELSDTCNALNFLLNDTKDCVTEFIDYSIDKVVFSSPSFILYWLQEQKDIAEELYSILEQGFEIRHKTIHDANFIFEFDSNFINAFEDCMIIFPQLISISLAKKFNTKRPVYNVNANYSRLTAHPKKDEYSFVFNRDDFEGEYEIID